MTFRKSVSAIVASCLVFGGAASAANAGAQALRQPASVDDSEQVAGAGIGWVIAALVAAGVAYVIIDDDDNDPASP